MTRRVLWLIKGLGPGGAERLLVSLADPLVQRGFEVHAAYLLPWKAHLVPELEAAGVTTHCLSGGRIWDARWVIRLLRLVQTQRIDVVHSHSPLPAAVARAAFRLLPRSRRPRLVYTEHNTWKSYGRPTRLANRLTYRLDDAQIAVSEDARDSIPVTLRERVEVVVHGVPVDDVRRAAAHRDEVRRELGLDGDAVLVVTVANYRSDKDYPNLLRAARAVTEADPRVVFVAVGQGPLEEEISRLHKELGLGARMRMLGYRSDAQRVIAAADIFCLSSRHEGYPVALMEALALGRPIVSTAVGGIVNAVRDGVEGLLVPPAQPPRLAEALLKVAGDHVLRAALGAGSAARGVEFSIDRAAEGLMSDYRGDDATSRH
jgi:glycosyltransferase involved in cell wall biosynthesis